MIKSKNIIKKILVILIMILCCNTSVYATDEIIQGADDFLNKGTDNILNIGSIQTVSDMLFNIFSVIGTAIVLIVGAFLGIKFIMGSVEEKAEVKEMLVPYIIGSVIIFGAFGIWSLVANVLKGVFA